MAPFWLERKLVPVVVVVVVVVCGLLQEAWKGMVHTHPLYLSGHSRKRGPLLQHQLVPAHAQEGALQHSLLHQGVAALVCMAQVVLEEAEVEEQEEVLVAVVLLQLLPAVHAYLLGWHASPQTSQELVEEVLVEAHLIPLLLQPQQVEVVCCFHKLRVVVPFMWFVL